MIASTIGRTFLKAYNEREGTHYTAKEFFEEEFHPLFYGSPKYMQWITNSPFVQGLSSAPNGIYGVREKIKGDNGKTMSFSSDNEAVQYFKNSVEKRSDFLYCQLPNFTLTKNAVEYLTTLELPSIDNFKKVIINTDFNLKQYWNKNDEGNWSLSKLGIQNILSQKFNCQNDALKFFSVDFVQKKGFFLLKNIKKISKKGIEIIKTLNENERRKLLNDFNKKAQNAAKNNEFDGSIAIGFPAAAIDDFATTSGLVSDINIQFMEDDIYYSWIGNGFSIGVAGGFSILFNDEDILMTTYEGWKAYRTILNDQTIRIAGNQIDTWNGQWLAFRYGKHYRDDFDFATLSQNNFFNTIQDEVRIDTISWSKVTFSLSYSHFKSIILGAVFSYGDRNKTLGFYPFHFDKAKTLIEYYKLLFGEQAAINEAKDYESLFGIHIKRACELGSIGLQALEPSSLRDSYGNYATLKISKPKLDQKRNEANEDYETRKAKSLQKDYENIITYRTYKTWLLAMITKNKEESLEYTAEVANALHAYRSEATKNDRKNLIQSELLVAKSKKAFLDALTTMIKDIDTSSLKLFKELRDRVHLMSAEDFGYFVVLLKFDYAYAERNI